MNLRNRKLVIAVRVLLGLFLLMSGVTGLMAGPEAANIPAPMIETTKQLWDMGFFQLVKVMEIVIGLMLVSGFLPALAAVAFFPIGVGIIVFNARMSPEYLAPGIVIMLLVSYLGYVYWDKYKALFTK